MSGSKRVIENDEYYRNLALEILSELNVIKIYETGDYYWEIDFLTDDLIDKAIKIAKDKSESDNPINIKDFKLILKNIYDEYDIEDGDSNFNKE